MIAGVFFEGSGLGDQLFRYITVRTLAEERGYKWGMEHPEFFKGSDFMHIDFGTPTHSMWTSNPTYFTENDIRQNGNDVRSYDPEINFVEDNTIIDGSFEDSKYWHHNLYDINKWLAVEPLEIPRTKLVIGFRGGEYAAVPELFLGQEYYFTAINQMTMKDMEVHTDDPELAKKFFHPDVHVVENERIGHSRHTNMGYNWRSMRYAQYAIIPNSAFFILPRLLKHMEDPDAVTIAPRYWAGHNTRVWKRPACYYNEFTYV